MSATVSDTAAQACLPDAMYEREIGGDVSDGPFSFNMGLYSDRAIKARDEADHPSRASDVVGVGWRATWVYHGPDAGPIGEIWGEVAELGRGEPPPSREKVSDGDRGGRDGGGIVLSDKPQAGDRRGLGIKLAIADAQYGALISFTLEVYGRGFRACDVSISKLTDG